MTIQEAIKSAKKFEIPVQHTFMLVDEDDFWFLRRFKWSLNEGYAALKLGNSHLYAHRLIMMAQPDFEVDHANRNRLDNRKTNLRVCSRSENRRNIGKRKAISSPTHFKGIQKSGRRWYARICINRKTMPLGGYATQEEAARAYDRGAIKYHDVFASLNFPITDYEELGFK